jgi:hypothetical protein
MKHHRPKPSDIVTFQISPSDILSCSVYINSTIIYKLKLLHAL